MLTARSSLRLLLTTSLFLAITSACSAQQGVDNSVNSGLPTNGVFHGSDIENVQVNNGNLHVDIPIYSIKGRGLDTSAHFVYDTKGWYFDRSCDGINPCEDLVTPLPGNTMILGASAPFNFQYLGDSAGAVCTYNNGNYQVNREWTNIILLEPNGTKHHFSPDPIADTANPCWEVGSTVYADDGSGWILQLGSNGTIVAINKRGTAVS